jgi:hypothetical protein
VGSGGGVVGVASGGGGVVGSGGGAGGAQAETNSPSKAIIVTVAKASFFTSFPPVSVVLFDLPTSSHNQGLS